MAQDLHVATQVSSRGVVGHGEGLEGLGCLGESLGSPCHGLWHLPQNLGVGVVGAMGAMGSFLWLDTLIYFEISGVIKLNY